MKKHDGVKRVFIGFLAAVTVLCMLPVQNVDAAGGEDKSGKYYILPDGKKAVGSYEINGEYYIFDTKGRLFTPKKNSLIDVENKTFYVSSRGTSVSGWQIIKKNCTMSESRDLSEKM